MIIETTMRLVVISHHSLALTAETQASSRKFAIDNSIHELLSPPQLTHAQPTLSSTLIGDYILLFRHGTLLAGCPPRRFSLYDIPGSEVFPGSELLPRDLWLIFYYRHVQVSPTHEHALSIR